MRLRNVKNKEQIMESSNYLIDNPEDYLGNWKSVFGNFNPIYIEIGMGKGNFIIENAKRYKEINFIGIEKYDSVVARALEKCNNEDLPNLRIIRMDALNIENVFSEEIDIIFLNFSDPWPKKRHIGRRLTSKLFLDRYDKLFASIKEIHQKTDNRSLFEYSIESLNANDYKIEKISLDLHNSEITDNIMTEYEEKFMKDNKIIYYLIAKK